MKLDPFIEAEEAAGHSVKRCCALFEVSRAAYYQRRNGEPSARDLSDAELTATITEIDTSRPALTARRGCTASCAAAASPAAAGVSSG